MVYSQRSYHQLPMITMKVTAALPLHLFSVVSHSSLHLSYFDHTVQTLQTPFMPTQVPTSLSSRCNKLHPFSGSYICLIFFVQLTSPKSPITTGSGSTPPKYLQDYILSSLLGLCELWDNLLLNVDGDVDISRILLLVCLFKKGDAPVGVVRRAGAFFFVVVLSCSCWPYYFNWVVAIKP